MGRSPCCDESGLKKGPWTPEEDLKLVNYIKKHGHGSWRALPKLAGLNRCGKSCRLRWTNYLRPDIKRGKFTPEEEQTILNLHSVLGNKWSTIATHLPGRTDNEIKNYWNTHLKKKLIQMGFDPMTHRPRTDNIFSSLPQLIALANLKQLLMENNSSANNPSTPTSWEQQAAAATSRSHNEAFIHELAKIQYLQLLLQPPPPPPLLQQQQQFFPVISNSIIPTSSAAAAAADIDTTSSALSLLNCLSSSSPLLQNDSSIMNFQAMPFSHMPDLQQDFPDPCSFDTTACGNKDDININNNGCTLNVGENSPDDNTLISSSPPPPWVSSSLSPSPPPGAAAAAYNNTGGGGGSFSHQQAHHQSSSIWPDLLIDDSLFHEIA